MKTEEVSPFANKALALFDTYFDEVKVFAIELANPFRDTIWVPSIVAASEVVMTLSDQEQNKGFTDTRNAFMDAEVPILNDLRWSIKECRRTGSITDTLASFYITPLIKSISGKRIKSFQTNYEMLIDRVNQTDNKAALIAQGFTQAKIDSIIDNHDGAINAEISKTTIEQTISNLSLSNQHILNACLNNTHKVINALYAMAKAKGYKELQKAATTSAILKSVRPTPPAKPSNRKIKKLSSIVLYTDFALKNYIQIILLTQDKVYLYRSDLKTGAPVGELFLVYKTPWLGKIADIPGTGRYIKVFNASTNGTVTISILKIITENTK